MRTSLREIWNRSLSYPALSQHLIEENLSFSVPLRLPSRCRRSRGSQNFWSRIARFATRMSVLYLLHRNARLRHLAGPICHIDFKVAPHPSGTYTFATPLRKEIAPMKPRLLAIVTFVALMLGRVDTSISSVLCKTGDGTLKVRSAVCQRKESRVDPVSLGLQGPSGPQGPQGPTGPQGIPGPLPKLKIVVRSTTFQIGYDQGPQTVKVNCLLGEVVSGGSYSIHFLPSVDYPLFAEGVWSWAVDVPNMPGSPGVSDPPPPPPVTIYATCISLVS